MSKYSSVQQAVEAIDKQRLRIRTELGEVAMNVAELFAGLLVQIEAATELQNLALGYIAERSSDE